MSASQKLRSGGAAGAGDDEFSRRALHSRLSEIERRFGIEARDVTLQMAERLTDLTMSAFRHEAVRVLTPLHLSLERALNTLRAGALDHAAALDAIERAQGRLRLLTAIFDGMREMTRVSSEPFRPENLRELLDEAAGLVRDGAPEILMHIDIDADPDLVIHARRRSLIGAARNILQNGLEATVQRFREDPEIYGNGEPVILNISARRTRSDDSIEVTFGDFGVGMDDEVVGDAFRPFSTSKAGGTGLGLTIVRKAIEMEHGGEIEIESGECGTTVHVHLPIRRAVLDL